MALSEGTWRVLDLLIKSVGVAVITGVITLYGIWSANTQRDIAERNRLTTEIVQLRNAQKEFEVNLNLRMFEHLTARSLGGATSGKPGEVRDQLLLLRLAALNFQDLPISLRPFFERLDGDLKDRKGKEEVRDIAREVARRQAFRLTFGNGVDLVAPDAKEGDEIDLKDYPFKVKLNKVGTDAVDASVILADRTIGPFGVTPFDMPMVDNLKIGDVRLSILLTGSRTAGADLRVLVFPSDLAEDRIDVKEIASSLGLGRTDRRFR